MHIIKYIHVSCAILTIISFSIRGVWMLQDSSLLTRKVTRILPHFIDAVLLLSGIILLIQYYMRFYYFDWLMIKLVIVILYILSGAIALRYGHTRCIRVTALFISWGFLAIIVTLAITRPASIF